MGCCLDNLRSFGIYADQWTTVAQDAGEWLKTVERFMAKFIDAGKSGLDYGMQ